MSEPENYTLTDADKTFILFNIDKLSVKEMAQHISKNPKENGQTRLGRAIKEFSVSQGLKLKTTKYEAKGDIELTDDQKEFCKNNYDKMKALELAKFTFKDEQGQPNLKLTPLSREFKAVYRYLQEIAPNFINSDEEMAVDRYDPPKSIYKLVPIVNRYVLNPKKEGMPMYEQGKLTAQDERNLRALLAYLNVFRFVQQINKYTKQEDRDLFESTFIRHTYDKTDLSQEEVDQYISLASKIVTSSQLQSEEQVLRNVIELQLTEGDTNKISISYVEALDNIRDKSKEIEIIINRLTKELNGSRASKMDGKAAANASFLNLVEAFKHKETRDLMIKMAEKIKEEESAQIKRLFTMDDMKALLAGVTKEELLGQQ